MTGPDIRRCDPDPDGQNCAEDESRRELAPGLPQADPLAALVPCPPFQAGAISLGPFDEEPFDLQSLTWRTPSGDYRAGTENVRCLSEWLTGALEAAGVTLGAFDRLQVHLIATDGWGPVQAVAGWITRARHGERSAVAPEPSADPAVRHDASGADPPGPDSRSQPSAS